MNPFKMVHLFLNQLGHFLYKVGQVWVLNDQRDGIACRFLFTKGMVGQQFFDIAFHHILYPKRVCWQLQFKDGFLAHGAKVNVNLRL